MASGQNEVEIVVKATDQTKGFADTKRGAKELTADIAKVEAELKALGKIRTKAEIEADTKVAETKIAATQAKLDELRSKPTSPKIEADIALAERNIQKLETQLQGLKGEAAAQINVRADTAAAEARLSALKAEARELDGMHPTIKPEVDEQGAESAFSRLKAPAAAAGAAAAGVFGLGLANSMDIGAANAKLTAGFNLTQEQAKKAGEVGAAVFAKGYTDNMDDVTAAIGAVGTNMVDLGAASGPQLEALTGKALKLASTFDIDVNDATRAAGRLMKSGLAEDADEAFDLITSGFQQVGDGAGDLLDTVNEYSPFLQRLGMDGEAAFGSLAAAQKLGIRDTDAWGDAIKEFSLRAIDTADSTTDAYKSLHLNADKTREAIAKGGPEAEKAMSQVVQALMKVKDPVERNRIGVELFGTQWEDTAKFILPTLDPLANKMQGVAGSTDKMVDAATTAKDRVQGLRNRFDEWTASLVNTEGPLGDVMTGISAFGPQAAGVVGDLAPLLAALKMSGVADEIRNGPGKGLDDLGEKAKGAEGKTRGLSGVMKGLAGTVGIGLAIYGIQEGTELLHSYADEVRKIPEAARDWKQKFAVYTDDWTMGFEPQNLAKKFQETNWDSFFRLGNIDIEFQPDGTLVESEMVKLKDEANRLHPDVKFNGRTEDAFQALADITQAAAQGKAMVNIDGNDVPVMEARQRIIDELNATGATVDIDGNPVPLGDAVARGIDSAHTKVATLVIDGDTDPFTGKVTASVEFAGGKTGVITLDGEPRMVNGKVEQAVQFADGSTGTVTIDGNPDPATGKVQATVRYADGSTGRILVDARTGAAESAITYAARNRSMTITVNWAGLDRNIDPRYGGGRITGGMTGGAMRGGLTWVGERGPELVRGMAGGGAAPGGMTWVGERGPELVSMPPGSLVYPTGQSQQMAAQGAGGGVQALQVVFGGNVDGAFATAFQMLVRTGKIQLKGVTG